MQTVIADPANANGGNKNAVYRKKRSTVQHLWRKDDGRRALDARIRAQAGAGSGTPAGSEMHSAAAIVIVLFLAVFVVIGFIVLHGSATPMGSFSPASNSNTAYQPTNSSTSSFQAQYNAAQEKIDAGRNKIAREQAQQGF